MTSDATPQAAATHNINLVQNGSDAAALQQAIRNRAIDTIAADQVRSAVPVSQRLLVIGMTLGVMLVFVLMVNFGVAGLQKIMDVWYPGSFSGKTQPTPMEPPPLRPGQPMYITVDPPPEEAAAAGH